MLLIAIDGACRRNGKPDCVSAGGLFIQNYGDPLAFPNEVKPIACSTRSTFDINSTNQRGELCALIEALKVINDAQEPGQIITDSEYLYNAIVKEWCQNWERKGWTTSLDEPVKNKDLWVQVLEQLRKYPDISCYHIKGHVIPFGKVTAATLLARDNTGMLLYSEVCKKFDSCEDDVFTEAFELFRRNHGYRPNYEVLRRFITTNITADAIATQCVEKADALLTR